MTIERPDIEAPEQVFPPATPEPLEPAPEYERLRRECPVARVRLPSGDHAWLVTGYRDNRALFADNTFSRAAATAPGAPRLRAAALETRSITVLDPPEHTRVRRLVLHAFTSARVERMRPGITRLAEDLLDAMVKGGRPADLVEAFARPLPIAVISELLGIPEGDRWRFRAWAEDYLGQSRERIERGGARLKAYFADLVEWRRAAPGDDLFSSLVTMPPQDRLDDEDLIVLGVTLLVAGFETVANEIACATVVLLRHPEQLRRLQDDPGLLPSAVEELLRFTPISVSGGTIRVALGDTELAGTPIRAGEGVLPAIVSADRDPEIFTDPDVLDLGRSPNPHIAFGHGIHRCLGAQLARAELQIAFATLLARLPGLRLAIPFEDLDWRKEGMIRGPRSLPVTW
ncbi:cytochrome P450 [Spirillospora sp. CA-294931]|uniref:cytochrome P450 n=1 Tax=Spirillospora sp. CA-294931 TaxID=3240042 RepID=UPI003D91989F